MKVIWTDGAADDLTLIVEYIRRDSHDAASRVAKTIYDRAMSLASDPRKGHKRRSEGEYETVCSPWPYVIIYEIAGERISIEGIVHAAQDRLR